MSKKNKKSKQKKVIKGFSNMLKEHKKDILIAKDERKISLSEATNETLNAIKCVPFDAIIPITSDEAAKKKKIKDFHVDVHYAKPAFAMYEYAMKKPEHQTIILTLTPDELVALLDYGVNSTITSLMERTNISLILKKMEKPVNKINRWLKSESEEMIDMIVLNIPDIILFTDNLKKGEVSRTILFDLCIQVVKTKKDLNKIKKKNVDDYDEITKKVKEMTIQNAISLGHTSCHIPMDSIFYNDKIGGKQWIESIDESETCKTLISNLIFSSESNIRLIEFANRITQWMGFDK